jgi:porin
MPDAPSASAAEAVRARFRSMGIEYGFIYTGEVLGNVAGGMQRGAVFDGKLETSLKADLGKIAGWDGLTLYANSFQLHGTGRLKRDYVGGLVTVSNIEALPTLRLSELWLEQKLAGGNASIRVGQLAADVEFFFSTYAAFFVNSDWPTIASSNLPSGGPAYPLSTPGVRLKVEPRKDTTFLLAVFNGDPAGPGPGDEQKRNRYGLNFRVNDLPFAITELQLGANQEKSAPGLASSLKIGAWAHFGHFNDQRFDVDGLSLADPLSNGLAFQHFGNRGIYGVIDQQLYRPPGGDASSGLLVFTRVSASPSDRNLVDFYFEGGAIATGLIPGRPEDRLGAQLIYAQISPAARGFDRDVILHTGLSGPVRSYEATFELSYQAQLRQGWILQPLFQYVWHPAGMAGIPDATVVGLRTIVTY